MSYDATLSRLRYENARLRKGNEALRESNRKLRDTDIKLRTHIHQLSQATVPADMQPRPEKPAKPPKQYPGTYTVAQGAAIYKHHVKGADGHDKFAGVFGEIFSEVFGGGCGAKPDALEIGKTIGPKWASVQITGRYCVSWKVRADLLRQFGLTIDSTRKHGDFYEVFSLSPEVPSADLVAQVRQALAAEQADFRAQRDRMFGEMRMKHPHYQARAAELRAVIQREHPDKGGDREKFEAAMKELDHLRGMT